MGSVLLHPNEQTARSNEKTGKKGGKKKKRRRKRGRRRAPWGLTRRDQRRDSCLSWTSPRRRRGIESGGGTEADRREEDQRGGHRRDREGRHIGGRDICGGRIHAFARNKGTRPWEIRDADGPSFHVSSSSSSAFSSSCFFLLSAGRSLFFLLTPLPAFATRPIPRGPPGRPAPALSRHPLIAHTAGRSTLIAATTPLAGNRPRRNLRPRRFCAPRSGTPR